MVKTATNKEMKSKMATRNGCRLLCEVFKQLFHALIVSVWNRMSGWSLTPGASIPMGQEGHVPPIFMKGGHPW